MRLTLKAPGGFSFRRTLYSHGWAGLLPFALDQEATCLCGVVARAEGGALRYRISERGGQLIVEAPGTVDPAGRRLLRGIARRVLNLDLDLSEFHRAARQSPAMCWIARTGSGRLLRAPTTFEDLIKLVLTTNCTWAFTIKMTRTLVDRYGEQAPDGSRAFPTPEALARAGTRELREQCRTGYRAPALAKLSRRVASGRLDPEAWERDERDPAELRKELLELPGVGPYVAENLLRFIGRPHGLGLDSAVRGWYYRRYHGGRRVKDRTIARRYARLGAWAGLAVWCDMTRDWLDERASE